MLTIISNELSLPPKIDMTVMSWRHSCEVKGRHADRQNIQLDRVSTLRMSRTWAIKSELQLIRNKDAMAWRQRLERPMSVLLAAPRRAAASGVIVMRVEGRDPWRTLSVKRSEWLRRRREKKEHEEKKVLECFTLQLLLDTAAFKKF